MYADGAMVRVMDKNPEALRGCATDVGPGTSVPYSQAAGPITAVHGRAGVESAAFHVLADPRPKRARSFARDRRRAPMSPRDIGGTTSAGQGGLRCQPAEEIGGPPKKGLVQQMRRRNWVASAVVCMLAIAVVLVWVLQDKTEQLRAYVDNGDRPGVVYDLTLKSGAITSVREYITTPEADGSIDGAQEMTLHDMRFDGESVSFSVQVRPTLSRPYLLRVRNHGGYQYLDITYYDGYTDSVLMTER